MKRWIPFLLLLATLTACDKGTPLENQPPETKIFVSSINLTGDDRLTSEVTLYWSGEDLDGYVTAYELSFDNSNWDQVTATDSTFNFDISGSDTVDVDFYVRAIDNSGAVDPTPAYLKVPVKNSPPTARFDSLATINDTVYGVFTALLDVNDPDGLESLDSLFFRINNSAWYPLTPDKTFLTIVPNDPTVSGAVTSTIFSGGELTQLQTPIDGYVLEGNNTIYVKARDIAGSMSDTDTSKVFYARRKTANTLVIGSHSGGLIPTPKDVYFPLLQTLGVSFDFIDIHVNDQENLPAFIDPTLSEFMNFYDQVFWYSDETQLDNQLYLEIGASTIQKYMNQGGKILISTKIPTIFDNNSSLTSFSPMDSVSTSGGQARIPTDSLISPYGSWVTSLDTLQSSSFITGADPFYPKDSSNIMLTAAILPTGGWTGPNIIAARTLNQGNTNQVFVTLELHRLNARPAALQSFFQTVLLNEFNW